VGIPRLPASPSVFSQPSQRSPAHPHAHPHPHIHLLVHLLHCRSRSLSLRCVHCFARGEQKRPLQHTNLQLSAVALPASTWRIRKVVNWRRQFSALRRMPWDRLRSSRCLHPSRVVVCVFCLVRFPHRHRTLIWQH
jgi:hypothetical protein